MDDLRKAYLFLMISLFLFSVNFPRFSRWEEWYRRQRGRGTDTKQH